MDKKALSLPILVSLVVGNMIGTGIYVLPASLAEYGTMSLLAWIYTSIGVIFIAITFTRLTKRFPKTGGPYVYCKEAFGRLVGFVFAYVYWLSYLVSIAGIAVASVGYLGYITPILNANVSAYSSHTALAIEIGVIWLFTLINIIGIHTAGVVQLVLTILKLTPLVIITIVGIGSIHLINLTQFTLGHESFVKAISGAAALTFWAFIGLESATVPAENTKGAKDIYKATLFGTLMTSLVYIASSVVLMGIIPIEKLKDSQFPFAEAATLLFGPHGATIITICAFVSGLGALNVCILIQGQVVFAAARDGLFPRVFASLSKHDVPIAAQLFSSSLVTLFLIMTVEPTLLKQFNNIALLAGMLTLLTYLAITLAELKFLIQSNPSLHKALLNKSLIIPALASLYGVWMISNFEINTISISVLLVLACIPIYFFTVRKYAVPE